MPRVEPIPLLRAGQSRAQHPTSTAERTDRASAPSAELRASPPAKPRARRRRSSGLSPGDAAAPRGVTAVPQRGLAAPKAPPAHPHEPEAPPESTARAGAEPPLPGRAARSRAGQGCEKGEAFSALRTQLPRGSSGRGTLCAAGVISCEGKSAGIAQRPAGARRLCLGARSAAAAPRCRCRPRAARPREHRTDGTERRSAQRAEPRGPAPLRNPAALARGRARGHRPCAGWGRASPGENGAAAARTRTEPGGAGRCRGPGPSPAARGCPGAAPARCPEPNAPRASGPAERSRCRAVTAPRRSPQPLPPSRGAGSRPRRGLPALTCGGHEPRDPLHAAAAGGSGAQEAPARSRCRGAEAPGAAAPGPARPSGERRSGGAGAGPAAGGTRPCGTRGRRAGTRSRNLSPSPPATSLRSPPDAARLPPGAGKDRPEVPVAALPARSCSADPAKALTHRPRHESYDRTGYHPGESRHECFLRFHCMARSEDTSQFV